MSESGRLELLQITLIVRDLAATVEAFESQLGLAVAFRDPSVDRWGLENVVLPMGTTFIEILSPTRADTPGGRHLDRMGGDGGYMVILKTPDLAPWRRRIERLGLQIAFEAETRDREDGQDWAGIHLHPAEPGGLMLSLDRPDPPDSWAGAGPDWRRFVRRDVVDGLLGIELESPEPSRLAARWSKVLDRPLDADGRLTLDAGWIDFRAAGSGRPEGLAAVVLHARERGRAGEVRRLGGVEFRLH